MKKEKKNEKKIDFNKVEWDAIEQEKLNFFFKEAVDYNDILIQDIGSLNNKAFNLLAITIAALSASTGFFIALWGTYGKEAISAALMTSCIGLGIVFFLLLLAIFPRSICRGRATPNLMFIENPPTFPYYKKSLKKIMIDGIASYNTYITFNSKVMKFRSRFLTAGVIGFFVVPFLSLIVLLICHKS